MTSVRRENPKPAASVTQLPGTQAVEKAAKPEPVIVRKHASWPREVWAILLYMFGIATGLAAYDIAANRNMDSTLKAVIGGQAIERAASER